MGKRAWIHVVPEEKAEGELTEYYKQERDLEKQGVDNILAVHSLNEQRQYRCQMDVISAGM